MRNDWLSRAIDSGHQELVKSWSQIRGWIGLTFFIPIKPLLKGWVLSFVGWGIVALVMTSHGVLTRGDSWGMHLQPSLRDWVPWAVFTPLIFRLVSRFPLERRRLLVAIPVHVVACALILFAATWWKERFFRMDREGFRAGPPELRGDRPPPPSWGEGGPERGRPRPAFGEDSRALEGWPPPPPDGPMRDRGPGAGRPGGPGGPRGRTGFDMMRFISFELPIYLMLLTGAHALLFFRREQERAASLARARLEALRMQLQPHFLFNTLNAIGGLIHEEPDKADQLVTALSDLLRLSLETTSQQELPLARELDFIDRYLTLMHARFEDRLSFKIEAEPETKAALVPPMLLQPIVENAVEHGLQPRPEGGVVQVKAWREGINLQLSVSDNGVGIVEGTLISEGIGLSNTRARLRELYGADAKLSLSNGAGLTVRVTLPFRRATA